jgi:sulfopropanediol 3-dehydrogenase
MVRFDYVVMNCATAIDLHDYELRELAERVAPVLDAVRRRGDEALAGPPLRLRAKQIERCVQVLPAALVDDLRVTQDRMRRLADAQRAAIRDFETEARPGARCGVRHVAVASAGVCLPADPDGRSLQAAQAEAIVARAAGVERIAACVPAAGNAARAARAGTGAVDDATPPDGIRPPALLVAALALAGVREIYLSAGVCALAALTFGTESIPRVETVVGAGDDAMAEAHRQLAAIGTGRLRPGILILADDDADPELIAADLISAHGCGPKSCGVLITTSPVLATRVSGAVERQLDLLPRGDAAARSWYERGTIALAADAEAACRLADRHGLECIQIMLSDPRWYLNRLRRCRQVFVGDRAGAALADQLLAPATPPQVTQSAVSVASFLRAITYYEGDAYDDGGAFARLHRLVGLEAHARACEARAGRRLPALAAIADS